MIIKRPNIFIILDFSSVKFLDASLCSLIGSQVAKLRSIGKIVSVENIGIRVLDILNRNGFIKSVFPEYKFKRKSYIGTEIPYTNFERGSEFEFYQQVDSMLDGRFGIPLKPDTKEALMTNLLEVYTNCELHSESSLGVFTCGQFFPQKREVAYGITDCGIGLNSNVRKRLGSSVSDIDCIEWALRRGNTTKPTHIPGGLGLANLDNFVKNYGGTIQIITGCAVYTRNNGKKHYDIMPYSLRGTSVKVTFSANGNMPYLF